MFLCRYSNQLLSVAAMMRLMLLLCALSVVVRADYWSDRKQFIEDEQSMAMGADIKLTTKEKKANEILMEAKHKELDAAFISPATFPPARHFFKAKKDIEKSQVFSILQKMPKGAALHIHDTSLASADYLIKNITYRDNLYINIKDDDTVTLAFADPAPQDENWQLLQNLRNKSSSVQKFDDWLASKFSLEVENPEEVYKDINSVWTAFMNIFAAVTPMLTYRPVFEEYFYRILQEFYDDQVMYLEMRGTLPVVYDLTGWPSNPIQVVGIMEDITNHFIEDHPDFLGLKFIYGPMRNVDNDTCDEYLQIFQMMQSMYPDFIAGFDLVGQEDLGTPLVDFVNELLEYEPDTKYFFHAGETNWNGMSTDMNLVDAVLLNTTRIGHGYALVKHPLVMTEVKKRKIGIEVNPISNQVLMLVDDLRNHPASVLFAQNYPVVISSDDPGFWGAKGLSYDFYEAFMGMASRDADIRMLKQLALNSLQYSALSADKKQQAISSWNRSWDAFVDNIIAINNTRPNIWFNSV